MCEVASWRWRWRGSEGCLGYGSDAMSSCIQLHEGRKRPNVVLNNRHAHKVGWYISAGTQ